MKIIGEGAEAKIYQGRFLGFDTIVKDRIKKRYRIDLIDNALRKQRTKREAKILYMAATNGLMVPSVLFVGDTTLIIKKIDGVGLHEIINENTIGESKYRDLLFLAGRYAGIMHNLNIAHGDYTPANMMLDKSNRLWIIDFGLSEITSSIEEKALDLLLMKRAIPKSLFENFLKGYRTECKDADKTIARLAEIEKRGRYQTRTLLTT